MRDRNKPGGKDRSQYRSQDRSQERSQERSKDRLKGGFKGGNREERGFKPRFKPRSGDHDGPEGNFRRREEKSGKSGGFKSGDFKSGGFKSGGFKPGGFRKQEGFQSGGFKRRKKQFRDPASKPALDRTTLYGWHPVVTALANPKRRMRKLLLTENAARRLAEEGITLKHPPELVRPEEIDRLLTEDAVHQGLYAEFDLLPSPELDEIEPGLILVLDQITDPHNFGAIVRSAAAFGVKAIVTTARHSPDATGVLAKSASGGLEHVPLVLVQNLARAMNELKSAGWQIVGLAEEGEADIGEMQLRKPLALVLGAEGKGLRQLTRETCDAVARLDLPGEIKSLNVSNAAALALYAASRKIAGKS